MGQAKKPKSDKRKRKAGRPPKPIPRKADDTPYTPEEVAYIITTTSPSDLQQWRENRQ